MHTVASKEDTKKLIEAMNGQLPSPVAGRHLGILFDQLWPLLAEQLKTVPDSEESVPPPRTPADMAAESLNLMRQMAARGEATDDLLTILLHYVGRLASKQLSPIHAAVFSSDPASDAFKRQAEREARRDARYSYVTAQGANTLHAAATVVEALLPPTAEKAPDEATNRG